MVKRLVQVERGLQAHPCLSGKCFKDLQEKVPEQKMGSSKNCRLDEALILHDHFSSPAVLVFALLLPLRCQRANAIQSL